MMGNADGTDRERLEAGKFETAGIFVADGLPKRDHTYSNLC